MLSVLEEPRTGPHPADVEPLFAQLDGLVESGKTVILEHDMRVVSDSDWVIDVGPGAGEVGGHVVAFGPPEVVATRCKAARRLSRPLPRPMETDAARCKAAGALLRLRAALELRQS